MRAERLSQQQAGYQKQQERIAHLQRFIDRFKAKASKAKQAQSRVKALARMEKLAPVLTSADFQFEFREPLSLPNPMLAFADVACGYPAAGADGNAQGSADADFAHARTADTAPTGARTIVSGIDRSVLAGQRIGILGANGQGKSTLVKTIAGDLPPLAGQITQGKGLTIGYFAQQELDVLSPADGPLMHMVRLARDVGPAGARAGAARFPRLVPLRRRDGDAAGRHAVGRREGAPRAGDAGLAAPQPAAARRADQPPRPDDPRGAEHGAQRVRGHGDAGQPRPRAAARGLRRVLAGRPPAPSSRSTATSTTTSAGCSNSRAPRRANAAPAATSASAALPRRRSRRPPMRPSRAVDRLPHRHAAPVAAEAPRGPAGRRAGAPAARWRDPAAAQGAEPGRQPPRRAVRGAREDRGRAWPIRRRRRRSSPTAASA